MTVLVVYASRHGATEGIAARIAARIADAGTAVDLRHVDKTDSLDGYDAVVFGAPVYDQSWPPEADQFVDWHRDALAGRPVWLFSVGSFGDTKRLVGPLTPKEPKRIADVLSAIQPRDYRVFRGSSASTSGRFGRAFYSTHSAGARRSPRLAGHRGVCRRDRAGARWRPLSALSVMTEADAHRAVPA